jgi:hypothetical protein
MLISLSADIRLFLCVPFANMRFFFFALLSVCANIPQVQAELLNTYVQPYDDVRAFTFKAIKSYAARPATEWLGEIYPSLSTSTPTPAGKPSTSAATPTTATTTSPIGVSVPTETVAVAAFCRHAIAALAQLTVPSSRDLVAAKYFGNPDATEADTLASSSSSSSSSSSAAAASPSVSVSRVHRGGVGNIVQQRRWHAEAWLAILRLPLPMDVYKTVLLQVRISLHLCNLSGLQVWM